MRVAALVGWEAGARGGERGATARLNLTACVCWTRRKFDRRGGSRRCTQLLSTPGCSASQVRRGEPSRRQHQTTKNVFFLVRRASARCIASPTFRPFLFFRTQPCRRERPHTPCLLPSAHSRANRPRTLGRSLAVTDFGSPTPPALFCWPFPAHLLTRHGPGEWHEPWWLPSNTCGRGRRVESVASALGPGHPIAPPGFFLCGGRKKRTRAFRRLQPCA